MIGANNALRVICFPGIQRPKAQSDVSELLAIGPTVPPKAPTMTVTSPPPRAGSGQHVRFGQKRTLKMARCKAPCSNFECKPKFGSENRAAREIRTRH